MIENNAQKLFFKTLNGVTEIIKQMITSYPDKYYTDGYVTWMINDIIEKNIVP